ncbi:MAG: Asp-tRNA(Asn)/Glu-tRNA(Gln) amidotransferase subunit GatC, partial [Tissierellaceae bacterium]
EKVDLVKELEALIDSVSLVADMDLADVEPLINIHPIENATRADLVEKSLEIEDVLMNAPAKDDNYILVPKVID